MPAQCRLLVVAADLGDHESRQMFARPASSVSVAPGCCARYASLLRVDPACLTLLSPCATLPLCRVSDPPAVPGSRPPPACGPGRRPSPVPAPRAPGTVCQSEASSRLAWPPSVTPVRPPHVPAATRSGCSSRQRPDPVPTEDSKNLHRAPGSAAPFRGPPHRPATGAVLQPLQARGQYRLIGTVPRIGSV